MAHAPVKRSLVILVWNEIDGLRAIVPAIPEGSADEIVVVDGGSTDGSVEYCRERGLRVVGQQRRGRGEAFRVGVDSTSGDALVFFSPDGNEDPAEIAPLFEQIAAGADLAIASRFLPGSRNEEDDARLPFRKWTNQAFTGIANIVWNRGPYVTDTINGYRAIRRSAFATLGLESMGYTIEFEMTIRSMKKRLRIVELPTSEGNRVGGETKAPSFRTGVVFLRFLLAELLRS
jgi:glycosyltransferase involved in cell wall biosynthesis